MNAALISAAIVVAVAVAIFLAARSGLRAPGNTVRSAAGGSIVLDCGAPPARLAVVRAAYSTRGPGQGGLSTSVLAAVSAAVAAGPSPARAVIDVNRETLGLPVQPGGSLEIEYKCVPAAAGVAAPATEAFDARPRDDGSDARLAIMVPENPLVEAAYLKDGLPWMTTDPLWASGDGHTGHRKSSPNRPPYTDQNNQAYRALVDEKPKAHFPDFPATQNRFASPRPTSRPRRLASANANGAFCPGRARGARIGGSGNFLASATPFYAQSGAA